MDLERQKQNFKNHKATFTDYGNIKILDFKAPNSSHYRIRFLFEEDYCRLHISGDLGHLIASNYDNMTFERFSDFVNNVGYFREKIDCHDRPIYYYDVDAAKEDLKKCMGESYYEDLDEYMPTDKWKDDIFEDFSKDTGISHKGYEALIEMDYNASEYASDLGKRSTGILDLYMLAFKLAMEQLSDTNMRNEQERLKGGL